MSERGNCFENSARFLLNAGAGAGLTLVHAQCVGRGPIEGRKYAHAFLLTEGGIVLDMTSEKVVVVTQGEYYELGQVKEVVRYDYAAMLKKLRKTKHWGPWHKTMQAIDP